MPLPVMGYDLPTEVTGICFMDILTWIMVDNIAHSCNYKRTPPPYCYTIKKKGYGHCKGNTSRDVASYGTMGERGTRGSHWGHGGNGLTETYDVEVAGNIGSCAEGVYSHASTGKLRQEVLWVTRWEKRILLLPTTTGLKKRKLVSDVIVLKNL